MESSNTPLNLLNAVISDSQLGNARLFRRRRNAVWIAFLFPWFHLVVSSSLLKFFLPAIHEAYAPLLIGLPFAISIVACVPLMYRYKCPNCKEIPYGVAYSIGAGPEVGVRKGVNPFPLRCVHCGYYLSEFALRRDLKKQAALRAVDT
jgi:hypothetical protein